MHGCGNGRLWSYIHSFPCIRSDGFLWAPHGFLIIQTVLETRKSEGKSLTQMAQNQLRRRKLIKDTAAKQADRVDGRLCAESPCRAQQSRISLVGPLLIRNRITGMQIERNIQFNKFLPENKVLFFIQIFYVILVILHSITINQCPHKSQFFNTEFQFFAG